MCVRVCMCMCVSAYTYRQGIPVFTVTRTYSPAFCSLYNHINVIFNDKIVT